MKKIIAFLVIIILFGFGQVKDRYRIHDDDYKEKYGNPNALGVCDIEYEIVIIDSCEYIMTKPYGNWGAALAHKGNCKNPIHNK